MNAFIHLIHIELLKNLQCTWEYLNVKLTVYGNLLLDGCNNNVSLETDKFGAFELETWIRVQEKT